MGANSQIRNRSSFLETVSPTVVGGLWVCLCGLVDWKTGRELGLSAFYLPGIILAAYGSGRMASLGIAMLATLVWLAVETAGHPYYSSGIVPYWNALIRLGIFAVTALLMSEIRIRKQTEAALKQQKDILSSVLDSMRDAVVVMDPDRRVILSNPAATPLLGSAGPENTGPLGPAFARQDEGTTELSYLPDTAAERVYLSVTTQPLPGPNERPAGVVHVFHDQTGRRTLDRRISEASEREQRRIGRDLHDGVCQHLAGISFAASTLQRELEEMDLPSQASEAAEVADLIREGIQITREISRGLHPAGIDDGLDVALSSLASVTTKRSGIRCDFAESGDIPQLDPETAGHLFRIAQECVGNSIRHGGPSHIRIHLECRPGRLVLGMSDDGSGLPSPLPADRGIGLQIMRHRADLIGAGFETSSGEGKGVSITISLPLPGPAPA